MNNKNEITFDNLMKKENTESNQNNQTYDNIISFDAMERKGCGNNNVIMIN